MPIGTRKEKRAGTFTVSPGREVYGELTLARSRTSLYLHDKEFFDIIGVSSLKGVLRDLTRVSLIDCIPTSGTGSGSHGDERYHFAEVFPHFIIFGDRHIAPEEKTIRAIHFVMDDATTLFYDFDAFGSLLDARPFIDEIVRAHIEQISRHYPFDRQITTGSDPQILYFTGKREIFTTDTVFGTISAAHNPGHSLGGPRGVRLKNTIVVTITPKDGIVFEEAIARTSTVLAYFGLLIGRPQNLRKMYLATAPDSGTQRPLRVYWSMPPKRRPSHEPRNPHPADVLLDGARQPKVFSRVLTSWLERQQMWRDARQRFFDSFAQQRNYPIDRLTGSANMFDILPHTAVPEAVELTEQLKSARLRARKIFYDLPNSVERESVLNELGRMGKSKLKQKVAHRARSIVAALGQPFADLITITNEAVNCRNYFVHGGKARFDYTANWGAVAFLTDTLEFVFAASDLIDAGWDIKAWSKIPSSMSHPFGAYRVGYAQNVQKLKALLPKKAAKSPHRRTPRT
jgi:hypothetical protein